MTAAEDPTFKDRRAQNTPDNLTKPVEGWPRWIIYMLASLVFGAIGGVIFHGLTMPLAWMIGAMIFTTGAALSGA